MKGQTAVVLIVVALFAGAAIGYFGSILQTAKTQTLPTTQSSESELSCDIAPQGSVLYVKIIHDVTSAPVTNATVDAVEVETCNGINTTIALLSQPTVNASGIATLGAGFDTSYDITVHYGTQSYPFNANVTHFSTTCATISIPSGSLSVTAC